MRINILSCVQEDQAIDHMQKALLQSKIVLLQWKKSSSDRKVCQKINEVCVGWKLPLHLLDVNPQ